MPCFLGFDGLLILMIFFFFNKDDSFQIYIESYNEFYKTLSLLFFEIQGVREKASHF